eukprot:s2496_g1.t1
MRFLGGYDPFSRLAGKQAMQIGPRSCVFCVPHFRISDRATANASAPGLTIYGAPAGPLVPAVTARWVEEEDEEEEEKEEETEEEEEDLHLCGQAAELDEGQAICWICRDPDRQEPLVAPCRCRGSMRGVHA